MSETQEKDSSKDSSTDSSGEESNEEDIENQEKKEVEPEKKKEEEKPEPEEKPEEPKPKQVVIPIPPKISVELEEGNELVYHCFKGELDKVKEFIELGCDLNIRTKQKLTPFSAAVIANQVEVVNELMKNVDCRVDNFDFDGETCLTYVAKYGQNELMEIFLKNQSVDVNRQNKDCRLAGEVITEEKTKEIFQNQKELEENFFKLLEDENLEEMKKVCNDLHIDCKNHDGETLLEVALKKKNLEIIKFLLDKKIRVEKSMAKLAQEYKELIVKNANLQTLRYIFVEIIRGEKKYLEKLTNLNKFYLIKIRKQGKKLVKKEKRRKELILYCDLIFDIKKESYLFIQKLMEIYSKASEMKEEEVHIEIIKALKEINYDHYLKFFQIEAQLSSDIKEDPVFQELFKSLSLWKSEIKLWRERTSGFFIYTLNIKDRIMAYQNLLQRIVKTMSNTPDDELYKLSKDTLHYIKTSIVEFDNKVKNEKLMKKMEEIFSQKWKMTAITQNKKRQYVHHEVNLKTILLKEVEENTEGKKKKKKKKKKNQSLFSSYSFFIFNDMIVLGDDNLMIVFFFHDTRTVVIFGDETVRLKIYTNPFQKSEKITKKSKEEPKVAKLLFDGMILTENNKVSDWYRNMKDFYLQAYDHYFFNKIRLINKSEGIEEDVADFLTFDKTNVIEIVQHKRDRLQKYRAKLSKDMAEAENEDLKLIDEIKLLRVKKEEKNANIVTAHSMMQRYKEERVIQNSPLVMRIK